MSTTHRALDGLVEGLCAEFADGRAAARGGTVAQQLGAYARQHADWRSFALFDAGSYTRNLVVRERHFELMVLCWGPGQESPIHNHEGQDCWMAVLEGEIEEVRFCRPGEVRPGPLTARLSKSYGVGQVSYIHDDIGLHLVRPARPGAPSVSLHLYAEPYDWCDVYCPETGLVTRKRLTNFSAGGRRLVAS
jgi:cysteine dioxygenase